MKYEEIVQRVKESFISADISDYQNHLAIQFNITGEGEGAFYVELLNGSVYVEPYEYYDRDVIFTMTASDLFDMIDGKLDGTKAFLTGKISVSNVQGALEVKKVLDSINAKKVASIKNVETTPTVKAEAETTTTVKTEAKAKTVSAPSKSTAKSSVAKKTTSSKSTKSAKAKKTTK